jgi:hypothetical protein
MIFFLGSTYTSAAPNPIPCDVIFAWERNKRLWVMCVDNYNNWLPRSAKVDSIHFEASWICVCVLQQESIEGNPRIFISTKIYLFTKHENGVPRIKMNSQLSIYCLYWHSFNFISVNSLPSECQSVLYTSSANSALQQAGCANSYSFVCNGKYIGFKCSVLYIKCLSVCPFSFRHCVVCPSSIDGFWLPHWHLQTPFNIFDDIFSRE